MTEEQRDKMIDYLISTNRELNENLHFREKKERLKLVRKGILEVLDNPEKYNLMPIPTDEEIEAWFTGGGNPDEKYWKDAPYTTMADVFDTIKEAFEHFKNRKA